MNKMLKPTIISIAMATVMAGAAISPALGKIAAHFAGTDPVLIKLILTAPALIIIPFSFISSYLTTKISKRSIVMIGLVIYVVAGVGAQFTNTIWSLLAFRFILGAGVGLVMPLSISLISDHFKGKEQVKMMGYNSAFSNLGGMLTMLVAGYLATFNWRVPFNVYFMGLGILVLVFFFLPKDKPREPQKKADRQKLPGMIYLFAFSSGSIMLIYYAISTNMALYLEQSELGGSELAGTVISCTTVGGVLTSLMLVRLQGVFRNALIPVTLAVMGIAFGGLAVSHSIPLIMMSVCLIGFGQGILFPLINIKALDLVAPEQSDKVIALISSLIYIGQFSSPLVLDSIGKLAGNPTIRFQYSTVAVSLAAAVLVLVLLKLKKTNSDGTSLEEQEVS